MQRCVVVGVMVAMVITVAYARIEQEQSVETASFENCRWTSLGCGPVGCNANEYVRAVDFYKGTDEACWGGGTDFDEPARRVMCCTFAEEWTDEDDLEVMPGSPTEQLDDAVVDQSDSQQQEEQEEQLDQEPELELELDPELAVEQLNKDPPAPDNTLPNIQTVGRGLDAYDGSMKEQVLFFSFNKRKTLRYWARGTQEYRIPDQLDVYSQPSCSFDAASDALFTSEASRRSEAKGKKMHGAWKRASFKKGKHQSQLHEYFHKASQFVAFSHGQCIGFESMLHTANSSVTSTFLAAVKKLPLDYSYAPYKKLIDDFGTHVYKSARLGGRTWQYATTASNFLTSYDTQSVERSSHIGFLGLFGRSTDSDKNSQAFKAYSSNSQAYQAKAEGGKAYLFTNWTAWAETIDLNPVIVDGETIELHELFDKTFVPALGKVVHWQIVRDNLKRALDFRAQEILMGLDPDGWTEWGCGQIYCPADFDVVAVDFSLPPDHDYYGCSGHFMDFDEPKRRIKCAPVYPETSVTGHVSETCTWGEFRCGQHVCPDGYYVRAIDFNKNIDEGCWGYGNPLDEPKRRIKCCTKPT